MNSYPAVLPPATGANLIQVNPPLVCGLEGCHRPAAVAWADPILLGPNTGSYYVLPICRECAEAALAVYNPAIDTTTEGEPVLTIYRGGDDNEPVGEAYALVGEEDDDDGYRSLADYVQAFQEAA